MNDSSKGSRTMELISFESLGRDKALIRVLLGCQRNKNKTTRIYILNRKIENCQNHVTILSYQDSYVN